MDKLKNSIQLYVAYKKPTLDLRIYIGLKVEYATRMETKNE
jgi:hypothetical protein